MDREKQILDYREPFNAPYMIREIAKKCQFTICGLCARFYCRYCELWAGFQLLIAFIWNESASDYGLYCDSLWVGSIV